jgi:transcription termination/antitermination protein NusA
MNGEFLSLVDAIVREKGIEREVFIQAIEAALASAAKKGIAKDAQEVIVTIDRKKGSLQVVADGKTLPSNDFSRIGAQTAKQVIMQKIREAERDVITGEFEQKVGQIVSGTVHRFEKGDIIVDLGRAEGILPKSERVQFEEYRQGERIQAYVLEVRKASKGAEVVLSRTSDGFIKGMFALEVPEISDGTVEIKAVAREAGERTKISVFSKDEKVDSQGACIGMRGTRVKNIVRELHGERVDVIRWHKDINEYIAAALAPAKISEMKIDSSKLEAQVTVDDDQLSLAIGKKGQNVRLASKLTGWQIDIKSKAQSSSGELLLRNVRGVGPAAEERLKEGGITSVEQLAGASVEQLCSVKGIGDKTAEKLVEAAKEAIEAAKEAAQKRAEAAAGTDADEKPSGEQVSGDEDKQA